MSINLGSGRQWRYPPVGAIISFCSGSFPWLSCIAAILTSSASANSLRADNIPIQKLVVTGDIPNGVPGDMPFTLISSRAVINSAGDVAFSARRAPISGSPVEAGLWLLAPDGTFSLIATEGGAAPISPPGNFFIMSTPNLSDSGTLAFASQVRLPYRTGIFTWNSSGVAAVATPGMHAPGFPTGVTFASSVSSRAGAISAPAITPSGRTAFYSEVSGLPERVWGVWSEATGSLSLVAAETLPAPGTPPGVNFSVIDSIGAFSPFMNDLGHLSFRATITGPGVDATNNLGLWVFRETTSELVARTGTQAPDTAPGVLFGDFWDPRINNNSTLAFRAALTGAVTPNDDTGIWSQSNGIMSLQLREGQPAASLENGTTLGNLGYPLLNAKGAFSVTSRLTGPSVTSTNDYALWIQRQGLLTLLAREGNRAPGTPEGVLWGESLSNFAVNAIDQVMFMAKLTGDGVTPDNDWGLWVSDPLLGVRLVVREGDPFEISPGVIKTIDLIYNYGAFGGGEDGLKEFLNDSGQLVISLRFTDGSTGLFLASVPEPSIIVMLIFAAGMWPRKKKNKIAS